MNPSIRLLKVMEFLMSSGQKPVRQVEIARELNLSTATVSRIIRSLTDEGYVQITSEKHCVCNFRLSRNVPMSERYLSLLNEVMQNISSKYAVSVEAVVVTGFELFWHSCTDFPDASVAIKARPGFRRTLSELDPLSRLYLSRMAWSDINDALLPGGFFRNDMDRNVIDALEARQIIETVATKTIDYDFDGNHLGVRRFVSLIDDESGRFMHLLSIAEAAIPVRDRTAHISEMTRVLSDAREILKKEIAAETQGIHADTTHARSLLRVS